MSYYEYEQKQHKWNVTIVHNFHLYLNPNELTLHKVAQYMHSTKEDPGSGAAWGCYSACSSPKLWALARGGRT